MNVLWLADIRQAYVELNDDNAIWIYYDDLNNERKNIGWMRQNPKCHVIFYRDNQDKYGYWRDENMKRRKHEVDSRFTGLITAIKQGKLIVFPEDDTTMVLDELDKNARETFFLFKNHLATISKYRLKTLL
jgi:hypothetical protein